MGGYGETRGIYLDFDRYALERKMAGTYAVIIKRCAYAKPAFTTGNLPKG